MSLFVVPFARRAATFSSAVSGSVNPDLVAIGARLKRWKTHEQSLRTSMLQMRL